MRSKRLQTRTPLRGTKGRVKKNVNRRASCTVLEGVVVSKAKSTNSEPVKVTIARLEEKVENILDKLSGHMKHHWCIESGLFLCIVGSIVAMYLKK